MPELVDIAIVGAGAAGLFAGAFAGAPGRKVVLLEGAKRPGTKILIAGGGRCNVTHDVVRPADYAGGSRHVVKKTLRSFTVEHTVAWFAQRGVELKREETGKLFPVTDKARTVLDALLQAVEDAGAELRLGHRVTRIGLEEQTGHFRIGIQGQEELGARRVILATGGQALPSSGSDGFGYELVKKLGHTVTPTWPSLAPLLLEDGHWAMSLSGVAHDVELTLRTPTGKALHTQAGPMLFTHFGLSGPAPMNLSRHAVPELPAGARVTANLLPGESFETVEQRLIREQTDRPKSKVVRLLADRLPDRLAEGLLTRELGIDANTSFADFTREDRRALAHALVALELPVIGDRGFKFAECTAGGVPLTEIEPATMRSRRCEGLFLTGELLDCDGLIGGYNFQWAWCTGRLAGLAAGSSIVAACNARTSPTP